MIVEVALILPLVVAAGANLVNHIHIQYHDTRKQAEQKRTCFLECGLKRMALPNIKIVTLKNKSAKHAFHKSRSMVLIRASSVLQELYVLSQTERGKIPLSAKFVIAEEFNMKMFNLCV